MNKNLHHMRRFAKPIWIIITSIVVLGFFIHLSSTMIPDYHSDYQEQLSQTPYQMSVSLKDEFRTKGGNDSFICMVSYSPINQSDVLAKAPLQLRFSDEQIKNQIKFEDGCTEPVKYSYFTINQ